MRDITLFLTVCLFSEPIIRHEFRAQPDDLRVVTVDGDSMEPLLSSGDRILVDTSQRIPVPPGIFVIWDGMGLVAKRGEHVLSSDPPKIVIRSGARAFHAIAWSSARSACQPRYCERIMDATEKWLAPMSTAERFPASVAEQKQASGARMGRDAKGPDRAPSHLDVVNLLTVTAG